MNRFERFTSWSRCVGVAMQVLAVVVPLLLLVPQRIDVGPAPLATAPIPVVTPAS